MRAIEAQPRSSGGSRLTARAHTSARPPAAGPPRATSRRSPSAPASAAGGPPPRHAIKLTLPSQASCFTCTALGQIRAGFWVLEHVLRPNCRPGKPPGSRSRSQAGASLAHLHQIQSVSWLCFLHTQ